MFSKLLLLLFLATTKSLCSAAIPNFTVASKGDVPIGGSCEADIDCDDSVDATCDPDGKICCGGPYHVIIPPSNGSDDPYYCLPIRNYIGEECLFPEQCRRGDPGEHGDCLPSLEDPSNKVCNCSEGAFHLPGENKCYKSAEFVDDSCEIFEQCRLGLGDLVECRYNLCSCVRGAIRSQDNRRCLPLRDEIGAPCEEDDQCAYGTPGEWSRCRDAKCECLDEAVKDPNYEKCYKKAVFLGDACAIDEQCTANIGNLSECGDANSCRCKRGAGPNGNGTECVKLNLPIGGACTYDEDCVDYPDSAQCAPIVNICFCLDDHEPVPPESGTGPIICAPIRHHIGDPCLVSGQCQKGEPGSLSDCLPLPDDPSQKVCSCSEGSVNEPGEHKCHPICSLVGENCVVNAQCTAGLGDLSRCSAGKCECSDDAVSKENKTGCLPIVDLIGGNCEESVQCLVRNSACFEGVCQCTPDSIVGPGGDLCLQKAELIGDACEIDAQCTTNLGELSECITGRCQCQADAVPGLNADKCLPIIYHLGDTCEDDRQCTLGVPGNWSECRVDAESPTNAVCLCKNDAVNEPGEDVCRKKAGSVGDSCLRNSQCKANLGNLSECLLGETCICTPGYGVPSMIGDRCLPVVNFIGGDCEEPQQCRVGRPGLHSDCVDSPIIPDNKICNCTQGADHEPGRHECIRVAVLIGEPCDSDDQCVGRPGMNSGCSVTSGVCRCLGGYVPSLRQDNCLPIRNRVGDICNEAQQCQRGVPGPLSNCLITQICSCTVYAVSEPGQNVCHRRAVLVGDPCQVHVQCKVSLGEYSHCLGESCECLRNAVPSADRSTCVAV